MALMNSVIYCINRWIYTIKYGSFLATDSTSITRYNVHMNAHIETQCKQIGIWFGLMRDSFFFCLFLCMCIQKTILWHFWAVWRIKAHIFWKEANKRTLRVLYIQMITWIWLPNIGAWLFKSDRKKSCLIIILFDNKCVRKIILLAVRVQHTHTNEETEKRQLDSWRLTKIMIWQWHECTACIENSHFVPRFPSGFPLSFSFFWFNTFKQKTQLEKRCVYGTMIVRVFFLSYFTVLPHLQSLHKMPLGFFLFVFRFGYLLQSIKQLAYSILLWEGKRWKQRKNQSESPKMRNKTHTHKQHQQKTSPWLGNRTTSEKSRLFYWHFRRRAENLKKTCIHLKRSEYDTNNGQSETKREKKVSNGHK